MKIYLLFYMCHFAIGLTHCYKTTVFLHLYICSFSTKFTLHVLFQLNTVGNFYGKAVNLSGQLCVQCASTTVTIRQCVYLTCSKKLTGSQLSLPHRINKKLRCETNNKMMSVKGPVQSRYREAVQQVKEIYGGKDLLKRQVLSLE